MSRRIRVLVTIDVDEEDVEVDAVVAGLRKEIGDWADVDLIDAEEV